MKSLALILGAAALLASCGGSGVTLPGNCSITLTGSVTATVTGCNAAATYDPSKTQGNLAVGITSGTPPAPIKTLALLFTFNTDIATGSFTFTSPTVTGVNLAEVNTDNTTYVATKTGTIGAGSLTVSNTNYVGTDTSGVKAYLPHGTLDGTLPQSGGAGSITVHATF